jgi:Fe(3+) dicitrate transport protein
LSRNCLNLRALGAGLLIGCSLFTDHVPFAWAADPPEEVQETLAAAQQDEQPPAPGQPPRIEVDVPAPQPTTTSDEPFTPSFSGVAEAFGTNVPGRFLPDVQGTRIYSGKKTENIDLRELPPIVNNNFREALIKTPGLILSEESSPLFSVGYRGLAPHRAQFTQVLQDGIPIHADMFGYPEAYYVPPLEFVERIDFLHGGASLMYGPQPGGALNFVMQSPNPNAPFSFFTQDVLGTHDFFSTSNAVSGTAGPLGYYGYFQNRRTNGFRSANSDFEVYYGGAKFITQLSPTARTIVSVNAYDEEHGEPGGLTVANFNAGSNAASRLNDRFQLQRYSGWMGYQEEIYSDLLFEAKTWATYYSRFSRRQQLGGFGTPAVGALANFELQEFRTFGAESRIRRDYGDEGQHTLAGGMLYMRTDSPRRDATGPFSAAVGGTTTAINEREVNYYSIFAENRFQFGNFSITPGVRLENIWQSVDEQFRSLAGSLRSVDDFDFQPLFGVGTAYQLNNQSQLYSNISQAYRPKVFTEALVAPVNDTVAGDLSPGESWQMDIGIRGNPTPYLTYDTSLFYMEFDDQIGRVGAAAPAPGVITNVGDSIHKGLEMFGQVDAAGLSDEVLGTNVVNQYGSVLFFASYMYLDAKFIRGLPAVVGKSPQYAPNYQVKYGTAYVNGNTRIQLAGTVLDDQWGDDSHTPNFFIPNYHVWDLTTNIVVYNRLSVVAGVNNLFNERYFSRVRADGIDPADGTNYYLGGRLDY